GKPAAVVLRTRHVRKDFLPKNEPLGTIQPCLKKPTASDYGSRCSLNRRIQLQQPGLKGNCNELQIRFPHYWVVVKLTEMNESARFIWLSIGDTRIARAAQLKDGNVMSCALNFRPSA